MKMTILMILLALTCSTSFASGSKATKEVTEQPAVAPAAQPAKTGSPIGFFQIGVSNLPRARAFYEKMFGWTFVASESALDSFSVQTGSLSGRLSINRHFKGSNSPVLFIRVRDIEKAYEKAFKLGAKKTKPIEGKPRKAISGRGKVAMLTDTEGNTIGLFDGER